MTLRPTSPTFSNNVSFKKKKTTRFEAKLYNSISAEMRQFPKESLQNICLWFNVNISKLQIEDVYVEAHVILKSLITALSCLLILNSQKKWWWWFIYSSQLIEGKAVCKVFFNVEMLNNLFTKSGWEMKKSEASYCSLHVKMDLRPNLLSP